MDIYFNELSANNRDELEYREVVELGKIYTELSAYKIKKCRIDDESYVFLLNLINKMDNNANAKNFFFAFFQRPFESADVIKHENEYYVHEFRHEGISCYGLALSYIMDSVSLSLGGLKWENPIISISVDKTEENVRNISYTEHVSYHKEWFESLNEIVLVERTCEAVVKREDFRDDHGKDELFDFANRLKKNKYFIEVVNSLPFNPHRRRFISAIKENGIIEIVLPWSDKGLGMAIKTTGRSFRETEKIANILEKEFGHV